MEALAGERRYQAANSQQVASSEKSNIAFSFIGQQAGLLAGYREQFSWMVPELNVVKSQLEALKTKVLSSDAYIAELAAMVEKLEAGRQRLYSFFNDLESQEKETASHAEGAAAGVVGSTDLEGLGQERALGQRISVATLFATAGAGAVPPAGAESELSK